MRDWRTALNSALVDRYGFAADKVRVFEVPIMPNAATSTAINWGDIHIYGATITERVEL